LRKVLISSAFLSLSAIAFALWSASVAHAFPKTYQSAMQAPRADTGPQVYQISLATGTTAPLPATNVRVIGIHGQQGLCTSITATGTAFNVSFIVGYSAGGYVVPDNGAIFLPANGTLSVTGQGSSCTVVVTAVADGRTVLPL
jgi:hypothetical protein